MALFQKLKIKTLGVTLIIILVLSGVFVAGITVLIHSDLNLIKTSWSEFQESRSPKIRTLTNIRAHLGYGGMIYKLNKFILKRDVVFLDEAKNSLQKAHGALFQYESLGTSDEEETSIREISKTFFNYERALIVARQMADRKETSIDIEKVLQVDDSVAILNLALLDIGIDNQLTTPDNYLANKPRLLSQLQNSLGYGGMIYHFKDFVLSGSSPIGGQVKARLEESLGILDQFEVLGVTKLEGFALNSIRNVLNNYSNFLIFARQNYEKGKSPLKINAAINIDDAPALRGLEILEREIVSQAETKAINVTQRLLRFSSLLNITETISMGLIALMITAAFWALRTQLLVPMGKMTNIMKRLAAGDDNFKISDEFEKGDQVGEMAEALSMFKLNSMELRRAERERSQALSEAEKATKAKSEFLANMSHELRTPLNSIIGFSDIIKSEIFGPLGNDKYLEYTGDIGRSGRHLLEIVNDILDLSKIEAGSVEINMTEVDMAEVMEESITMVEEQAKKAGINLVCQSKDQLPHLLADRRFIKQVLLNLLSNSVKFTPRGGDIKLSAGLEFQDTMKVSVADTGIGISPEDIPKVLKPFGQVQENPLLSAEGTGLGLAVSKSLMELHGGTLDIESQKGKGTTVTLCFPF